MQIQVVPLSFKEFMENKNLKGIRIGEGRNYYKSSNGMQAFISISNGPSYTCCNEYIKNKVWGNKEHKDFIINSLTPEFINVIQSEEFERGMRCYACRRLPGKNPHCKRCPEGKSSDL